MFSYCYLCWMVMMVCGFRETMWVSWWLDCHTDMKTVLTLLSGNHCLLVLCGQRHAEALSLLECPAWIESRTVHSSYWYNYHCCGDGCHSKSICLNLLTLRRCVSQVIPFECIDTYKVSAPVDPGNCSRSYSHRALILQVIMPPSKLGSSHTRLFVLAL